MTQADKEKKQRIMAAIMVVAALLISWFVFYNGSNSKLNTLNAELLEAQQNSIPPSQSVDADKQTIKAATIAGKPMTRAEMINRVKQAAKKHGVTVKKVSGAGTVAKVEVAGENAKLGQFLQELLSSVKIVAGRQLRATGKMLIVRNFEMVNEGPTDALLTAEISAATPAQ